MEHGIRLSVVGEIVPYSFANEETGEQIGLVHLKVPGDVVSVSVEPAVAQRMKEGEIWQVEGIGAVSKKKAQLRITRPEVLRRIREAAASGGPKIEWGDKAPASTTKAA